MEIEQFPEAKNETNFDALLEERKSQGWHYIEREGLTCTKLDANARFVEVPYQTEDDIKNKWLQQATAKDPAGEYEVELVLDYNSDKLRRLKEIMSEGEFQEALKNLNDEDKSYFVFLRKKA